MNNPIEALKESANQTKESVTVPDNEDNKKVFNNDGCIIIDERNVDKPEVFIWVQGMKFKLQTASGFDLEEAKVVSKTVSGILKIPEA